MDIQYTIIRQSRKTLGIYIRDGMVEIRAPLHLSKAEIDKFVLSKENWITKKLAAIQERQEKKQEFKVDYGSEILWRGKEYPLIGDSGDSRIWRDEQGFHFPTGLDEENLKYNVIRLYKICAEKYLVGRVRYFAEIMGVIPSNVKITDAKTRWGSCSEHLSKNPQAAGNPVYNVNFSWRLCMAEDDVIDAVVVHELAHIKEMNHSPAFYMYVKSVLPDYDERDAKLKQLSKRLGCEDWDV